MGKGTDGSGSSTRNPRPVKRPGKRAHTCPPSDPRYLLTFPLSHHHCPLWSKQNRKIFCQKGEKTGKKGGEEAWERGERIEWVFPIPLSKN
jgi:hypothetical protein